MKLRLSGRVITAVVIVAFALGVSACGGGSGVPVTPVRASGLTSAEIGPFTPGPAVGTYPPSSAGHLYIGASNSTSNGGVIAVAVPLGPSSKQSAVLDDANSYGVLAVNRPGRMFAELGSGGASTVDAFALPLTASSSPLFSIGAQGVTADAFDAAGDLIAAQTSCNCIAFYSPPIDANAEPVHEYSLPGVTSLTVENERIFATVGANDDEVLDPPYVSPTLDTSLGGIPVQDEIRAQTIDPHGLLIVAADYNESSGTLETYPLPLTAPTASPVVSLALAGAPTGFAFDQQGRLVVSVANCLSCDIPGMDSLVVYDLPLTESSEPVLTYTLSANYDVLGNLVAGP